MSRRMSRDEKIAAARRILIRGPELPDGFGDGWMSGAARDMLRIAVTVAGFDVRAMHTLSSRRAT